MEPSAPQPPLFDAHCHIDASPPPGPEPFGSAVSGRLLCGVGPEDWQAVTAAAAAWPGTRAAYGLHPWRAGEAKAAVWAELEQRLAGDPGAWLGEAGLDWLKTAAAPDQTQAVAFRIQLRLARRLARRANLHCVKAWDDFVRMLDAEYLADGPRAFIVHSFGGPHQFIKPLAERGAYFTVGPLQAHPDSPRRRTRAALLPADRLLLESDAFLRPGHDAAETLSGVLAWLAGARGEHPAALAERIAANSRRLFES